jgi:hypothetical protein
MFKQLTSKLEYLFENDSHFNLALEPSVADARKNFVLTENLSQLRNLSYVFNNEINARNIESLFAQIACFFEINFLMVREKPVSKFKVCMTTLFGKKINNLEGWPAMSLPEGSLYTVYRTGGHALLRKFGLQDLDADKKMTAFLLPVTSRCTFVFVTKVADPWSKVKIETLQDTLMKINFNL